MEEDKHARFLYHYLKNREVDAKTIVVESNYVDRDYLQDFAAFYVGSFYPYGRLCKRVHFFDRSYSESAFARIIRGGATQSQVRRFQRSYIGFIVVRPLPEAFIGRTQLRTYRSSRKSRHYTAVRDYHLSLYGIPLTVRSMAYQEQDRAVAACATVALWSCFQKTAELFDSPTPRPPKITNDAMSTLATRRAMPQAGLTQEQICSAIIANGLDPEVYNQSLLTPGLIYGYLRAGIPVLMVVHIEGLQDPHAIVLNGYSFENDDLGEDTRLGEERIFEDESESPLDVPTIGTRVKEFYVHDDQVGPFCHLYVKPPTEAGRPFTMRGSWTWDDDDDYREITPQQIIVPLHPKIRLSYREVEATLRGVVNGAARSTLEDVYGIGRDKYEWDISLISTKEYKESIRRETSLSQARRDFLLQSPQPKYFWRCILRLLGSAVLEVALDSTQAGKSSPAFMVNYFIAEVGRVFRQYLNHQPSEKIDHHLRMILLHEHRVSTMHARARLLGRRRSDAR